jgi:hypothetical protein
VCDYKDVIVDRQLAGLYVALFACLSSFFFYYVIHMASVKSKIDELSWDLKTATVADFSIELVIPEQVWDKWKEYKDGLEEGEGENKSFRDYLKEVLIKAVSEHPAVYEDAEQTVDIACIMFAYDNYKLISLLKKRGAVSASGKFEKLSNVEQEISSCV